MRRRSTAHVFTIAVLMLGIAEAALFASAAFAQQGQGQLPLPPGGFHPPPMPPVKPYQLVAVTPPAPFNDQSFIAFRKQLGDVAAHKDRAGLAKMVVAQGFFWVQDKDLADKRKSGIDNLAKAISLDANDGTGWDVVTGFANEPSATGITGQEGRLLRAGRSDHRPGRARGARQGDANRALRLGLSDQGRH